MRVTFVRGRLRVCVVASPFSVSRVVGSSWDVHGGEVLGVVLPDMESDGGVDDPAEGSAGPMISEVSGGRVLVMVGVVDAVVLVDVDEKVGSTKLIGASCGLSASPVNATTPQTTSAITANAATLAPSTAGVE
ncbi:hypothetical protein JNN96_35530 [Mycobacterium sp. DSM 3803]|nr:hypothetical protein [Mycobacterium sp. DSM 3803]